MLYLSWEDIKRQWTVLTLDLALLLLMLGITIGAAYISSLLIPVIISALAPTLLPYTLLSVIATLPLIACAAIMFKLCEYAVHAFQDAPLVANLLPLYIFIAFYYSLKHILADLREDDLQFKLCILPVIKYKEISSLAALGLGIYLVVKILPALIPAIISTTGVPLVLAFLFTWFAALGLILIIQDLLTLPATIADLIYATCKWFILDRDWKDRLMDILTVLPTFFVLGFEVYAAYIVFPFLIHALVPLLPTAMATFTAIALCTAMLGLTLYSVPAFIASLTAGVKMRKFEPTAGSAYPSHIEIVGNFLGPKPEEAIELIRKNMPYTSISIGYEPVLKLELESVEEVGEQSTEEEQEFIKEFTSGKPTQPITYWNETPHHQSIKRIVPVFKAHSTSAPSDNPPGQYVVQ